MINVQPRDPLEEIARAVEAEFAEFPADLPLFPPVDPPPRANRRPRPRS